MKVFPSWKKRTQKKFNSTRVFFWWDWLFPSSLGLSWVDIIELIFSIIEIPYEKT